MPYTKPPEKIKNLPPHAQEIWVRAFNEAWRQYNGDEAKAHAVAWAAVKKLYYQDQDGKWHRRKEETKEKAMTASEGKTRNTDVSTFISLQSPADLWSDLPGWTPASTSSPPEWIRVLPLGKVVLNDDREPFTVTKEGIRKIIDKFRSKGIDMVIDYEHKTMSGDPAPAAGWVKELEEREDGLWAYVQWTEQAANYIKNREYRYYSPTIRLNQDREVEELLHIGLTNFPAISGLSPLVLKKADNNSTAGGFFMKDMLINILALDEDSSDADIVMAVRELADKSKECEKVSAKFQELTSRIETLNSKLTETELRAAKAENELNKVQVPLSVTEALGLSRDANTHEVVLRIEGFKEAFTRVKELENEISRLKMNQAEKQAEALIEEALKTGRTSPAELEKADGKLRKLALSDPEFFKEFILGRPEGSVVPLDKLPNYTAGRETDSILNPEEERILRLTGLTVEQYKAQKEAEKSGKPFVGF